MPGPTQPSTTSPCARSRWMSPTKRLSTTRSPQSSRRPAASTWSSTTPDTWCSTEAFTPEQIASVYDTNVVSTQRVNRAALPHLRAQRDGLVVWVGSSSTRGGTPPYLAPYFAAKAGMDSLAVSYAAELARFGIDSTIVVPGSFTTGTNHFANAGHPADHAVAAAYESEYAGLMDQVATRLAELAPTDQEPTEVARAIVQVVDTPKGSRPFRVHIDPADDGAEVVNAVGDRIRQEFYRRIGLETSFTPPMPRGGIGILTACPRTDASQPDMEPSRASAHRHVRSPDRAMCVRFESRPRATAGRP